MTATPAWMNRAFVMGGIPNRASVQQLRDLADLHERGALLTMFARARQRHLDEAANLRRVAFLLEDVGWSRGGCAAWSQHYEVAAAWHNHAYPDRSYLAESP